MIRSNSRLTQHLYCTGHPATSSKTSHLSSICPHPRTHAFQGRIPQPEEGLRENSRTSWLHTVLMSWDSFTFPWYQSSPCAPLVQAILLPVQGFPSAGGPSPSLGLPLPKRSHNRQLKGTGKTLLDRLTVPLSSRTSFAKWPSQLRESGTRMRLSKFNVR